jgi:hypothetical protein
MDDTNFGTEERFEWTQIASACLINDESSIFETEPIVLSSKQLKKPDASAKKGDRKNNRIYFMLVPSVYSIRSFLDFNTQQTEYISLRYMTISPPFQLQNLIPSPLTVYMKDIIRTQTDSKG